VSSLLAVLLLASFAGAAAAQTPDPGYTDPFGGTANAPKVRLKQGVYRMSQRGVLRVPVTCPAAAEVRCVGRLGVRARGARAGSKRFSIARGKTAVVRVTLDRATRRFVRRRRRVRMRLTAVTRRGDDRTTTGRRIAVKAPGA
jgi:hypothetical protein